MEQLPDKIVKAVLLFENEQSDIDSSKVTLTAEEDKITGGNCQVSLKSNLTAEEEEIANKFCKMIKMHIPIVAVKHKMTMEHVDSKIVQVVLMYEFENVCINSSETNLTAEETKVADRY